MHVLRTSLRVLPLFVAAASAGCADGSGGASPKELEGLRTQVQKLSDDNKQLADRLGLVERRLGGVSEDLASVRKTAVDASVAASSAPLQPGAGQGEAAPKPAGTGSGVHAFGPGATDNPTATYLNSDEGRKALETAMRALERKRDDERTASFVNDMVNNFAQKANLTELQKTQFSKIMARSAQEMRGVFAPMRDGGEMTPEERAASRQAATAKMEEVRTRTDDEVKSVLDSGQYEMYQQDTARFRGMGGGGPGGGGFGGRGGR